MTPRAMQPSTPSQPTPLSRLIQIGCLAEQAAQAGDLAADVLDPLADLLDRVLGQVLGDATGPYERVVHAQAGDHLEHVEAALTRPQAVGHAGERAHLHAAGGQRHPVRRDPVDLHDDDPG